MLNRFHFLAAALAVLSPLALAQPGRLELGDHQLDSGEYFDFVERELQAGVPVTIAIASAEFDPYLIVIDPNDEAVFQADDSEGQGLDVREVFTPAVTGTHLILVTSATAGESGAYTLTVETQPAAVPANPLAPGTAPANPLGQAQAAPDPFVGEFRSDGLTLALERGPEGYRGELVFNGQAMPVVATTEAAGLQGTFTSNGATFPFSARLEGGALVLETGGASYRLERSAGAGTPAPDSPSPQNPLQNPTSEPQATLPDNARLFEPRPRVTPAVPEIAAEPGYMKGVVLDRHGAPIAAAKVTVYGTTIAGENTRFELRTGADGTFRQRVPDGFYGISAYVERSYAGDSFELPVPAVDGSTSIEHDAAEGGVENFVWYLEGLRQPDLNPDDEFSYHGMYFTVQPAPGFEPGPHLANATIEVILTPAGPLMDGSEGRTLAYRHTFAPDDPSVTGQTWGNSVDLWWELLDIPVGSYTMTARLIQADGTSVPLRVSDRCCDAEALTSSITFHPTPYDITRTPEPFTSKFVAP